MSNLDQIKQQLNNQGYSDQTRLKTFTGTRSRKPNTLIELPTSNFIPLNPQASTSSFALDEKDLYAITLKCEGAGDNRVTPIHVEDEHGNGIIVDDAKHLEKNGSAQVVAKAVLAVKHKDTDKWHLVSGVYSGKLPNISPVRCAFTTYDFALQQWDGYRTYHRTPIKWSMEKMLEVQQ